MKTNVIMIRQMGGFKVLQRTDDSMFNATNLLEQWNRSHPTEKRDLDNFWKMTHLKELMTEIAENLIGFKSVDFTELKKVLSRTKRGRHNSGTWLNPILFIKFAMYLSPKFEYSVIRFVYDELVRNRHLAGDNYNRLTASAAKFYDTNYIQIAKGLNWVVFNKHYKGIREVATESQLEELHKLEDRLSFAIDMGLINSYNDLIRTMRQMYNQKYQKF